MVRSQIEARGIRESLVLSAFRKVPRHLFVSEALREQAYGDYPLPIGEQQTISQPYIVAEMTQALELSKEDRVLEIGTGSGYQAAILAQIVYRVYTVERKRSLYMQTRSLFDKLNYHNIVTRYADGTKGWQEESPFRCDCGDRRRPGRSRSADQSAGRRRPTGGTRRQPAYPGAYQDLSGKRKYSANQPWWMPIRQTRGRTWLEGGLNQGIRCFF